MDTNASVENAASGKEKLAKSIRTFAGDMETLQKGGKPDLAPLPAPPVQPVRAPVPVPTQPPMSAPAPAPAQPPDPVLTPLKTYSGDFTDRMKAMQASTATVLAAEQDSAPTPVESSSQGSPRSNILYLVAGSILFIIGGVGAYIGYTRYMTPLAPVVLAPSVAAPIFVDDREQISGTDSALLVALGQAVVRPLAPSAIRLLSVTDAKESVFSLLPLSAPDVLRRNIQAAGSMAGVVNIGGSQSPFFILSVSSYSNTFSGMLSWEKTMPRDLIRLFPPHPVLAQDTATSTVATTTAGSPTSMPSVAGFVDTTVANHDARIYRDTAGRSVLLYGYWNQTTLVIARDQAAFAEILGRLATSRAQN